MSENRYIYIDKLLSELESLSDSVHEIKNSDSMPFSFFRESFERTQQISHLLHKLEFMQVDDMKNQMEKLVFFLSESEKKGKSQERELEKAREIERELTKDLEKEKQKERELSKDLVKGKEEEIERASDLENVKHKKRALLKEQESEKLTETDLVQEPELESKVSQSMHIEAQPQPRNNYLEGFVLPEYRNPLPPEVIVQKSNVSAPMHIIDIKRGVSLNDRFLFQRELFNNNRNEMNNTLEQLNSFGEYEEAEKYLRDNYNWDFENQIVNDFLFVVKKGFK